MKNQMNWLKEPDCFSVILQSDLHVLYAALCEIKNLDLVLLLIDAPTEVTEKVMSALSERAQKLLRLDVANTKQIGITLETIEEARARLKNLIIRNRRKAA
jgi:flagellar motor switch protein FliG